MVFESPTGFRHLAFTSPMGAVAFVCISLSPGVILRPFEAQARYPSAVRQSAMPFAFTEHLKYARTSRMIEYGTVKGF